MSATIDYQIGDKIGNTTVVGVRKVHRGRVVLDVERRDGDYRLFTTSLMAKQAESDQLTFAFSHGLEIVNPCWLIARGDTERVEVLRSPLVRDGDGLLEPVQKFIAQHGLVLATQETFEDADWMFGEVEMSVYISQEARDAINPDAVSAA